MTAIPTPAAAVLVTHKVRDYGTWRKSFEGHEPARRKAGILGHHVNQAADDPNNVSVYFPATSAAQLQAFGSSADLKEAMQRAGVIGEPTVVPMVPVENRTAQAPMPAAIVTHDVADFDAWKRAFDADAPARTKAGIVGYALNRRADRPNTVVAYMQAGSLDQLKAFANSPDLKATMQRAGVIGAPQILFVNGLDSQSYS